MLARRDEIQKILADAGIDGVSVYQSAIEVDTHCRINGEWAHGYLVLGTLIDYIRKEAYEDAARIAESARHGWSHADVASEIRQRAKEVTGE
jgi:hypothetical protein